MYFLLAAVAVKFHLLSYGLAVILVFIGTKMLLVDVIKIPVLASLGVVVAILAITMLWSVKTAPRLPGSGRSTPAGSRGSRGPPPRSRRPPRRARSSGSARTRSSLPHEPTAHEQQPLGASLSRPT